jgi:hypothetical protein
MDLFRVNDKKHIRKTVETIIIVSTYYSIAQMVHGVIYGILVYLRTFFHI